jgi:hypothetical protein
MTNPNQPEGSNEFYADLFEGLDEVPTEPMLDDPWNPLEDWLEANQEPLEDW